MAKKTQRQDPSNYVHDNFRMQNAGVVDIPVNSKPAFDNFHVDRSRLGTHEEYDPSIKPFGGFKQVTNDIMTNVRRSMGSIGHCSSNKKRGE